MYQRALLIYPPTGLYDRYDRCQSPVEEEAVKVIRAPLDLLYIAATLEQVGVECRIRDYPALQQKWENFKADLKDFNPDMLVISVVTPTLVKDMEAAVIAKNIKPDILTIVKGAYFSDRAREVMEAYKGLDIAIRGEYEFAVQEVAKGAPLNSVLGITFRENGAIKETADRPLLEDLDLLPFPARHLIDNSRYLMPGTEEPMATIMTGKGCPCQCVYCLAPLVSGRKLHLRKPGRIVDELAECVKRHNIHTFWFRSDTFTMRKDWVIELCQGILDRGLKIKWATNSRVDTIDLERLQWMKQAGCFVVGYGIESGNQEILDKMKKGITLEQARRAVALTKQAGLEVFAFFIVGMPWENRKAVFDTIRFAKELDADLYNFSVAYPFPETELYAISRKLNLLDEECIFDAHYAKPALGTMFLSKKEVKTLANRAYIATLLRPRYIFKKMVRLKSPVVISRYIKAGFTLFKNLLRA
ncbi:MAG: B12-binding domain-containing radical SAM protein [Candidatus Omnitrophota bacterium]